MTRRRPGDPKCPLCGSRRNATDEWCGGNRCLNALNLYMAGKIQSAAAPYDVPETRARVGGEFCQDFPRCDHTSREACEAAR